MATLALSLLLLLSSFFLLLFISSNFPNYPSNISLIPKRSLVDSTSINGGGGGFFSYRNPSFAFLSLLFLFYLLIKTAQDHFSLVTTKLTAALNLTPSMAAVTLLSLGNGAPDVFASLAAVRRGNYRTGFGEILSAGAFVSAFVVGFVAIYAAPFGLEPATFVRDVMFYLIAATGMFYVYLSAEIYLWQAAAFVGFYLFFVGVVFWMDLGLGGGGSGGGGAKRSRVEAVELVDCEIGGGMEKREEEVDRSNVQRGFDLVGCFSVTNL